MQRIFKNTAGQTITLMAVNADGVPLVGAEARLTAHIEKDGTSPAALADTSAVPVSATLFKGLYRWSLSQAETNGVNLIFGGISSDASEIVIPVIIQTEDGTLALLNQYVTNEIWSLLPIWNKINDGQTTTTNLDKTGYTLTAGERTAITTAVMTAIMAAIIPADLKRWNGHPTQGDGSLGNPADVVP